MIQFSILYYCAMKIWYLPWKLFSYFTSLVLLLQCQILHEVYMKIIIKIRIISCVCLQKNTSVFFVHVCFVAKTFITFIFKLILGYCAMRCNLFIYTNLMWIEKNQDKSSCTAYNQITPGLYIYVGSDSNQWFSFIAFQDVFAPSVQW